MANVNGQAASVAVAAPVGVVFAYSVVDGRSSMSFQARTSVTAQATMEFEAGQPVQAGLTTLASDQWFPMYPG